MSRADALLRRAEGWVFAAEDPRRLASVRIGLCGLLALRMATTDYRRVAAQPAALFQPTSYMRLLGRMPSQGVATNLQICGILAALIAAAGLAARASLSVALACSLVLDGMQNSAGRVIVGDAVLTLCLVVLLASGRAASDAWTVRGSRWRAPVAEASPDPRPSPAGPRHGWPIRTAQVTIALSLLFAGLQKLRYSGIAWVTSDNMRWILYASSDRRPHPSVLALFIADRPWLAHLAAAGSLLLELSFPLVLFVPRLRWPLIAGVVVMHEAIRLAIGLDYSAQWLTMVIVFADWPRVVAWLQSRQRSPTVVRAALVAPRPQS